VSFVSLQQPGTQPPSNHNVGSAYICHLTLTITSGQRDPNSWRSRSLAKLIKIVDDRKRTYLQVTQNMQLLQSWNRADARLRSFTWRTSYDPGHRDPR